jgi:NADH dehydrogenase [ubiquinone] 1 alpha subcomplex assembly factor 1
MLYGKIRTVGFSLLGGGRGAEGVSSVNQTSPAQIAEFRRRAQAGYGKGGGKEDPDPVVEDMLKADGYGSKQVGAGGVRPGDPARASGYHRVPSVSAPAEGEVVDQEAADRQARAEQLSVRDDGTVKVTPWSEGYYELCVRSVQAVVFDPMADEEGPETRDM